MDNSVHMDLKLATTPRPFLPKNNGRKLLTQQLHYWLVSLSNFESRKSFWKNILMASKLITPGELAPDFELEDINGKLVRLSDFREDKPVVLAFLRGFM